MRHGFRTACFALLSMTAAGCFNTVTFPAAELQRLDGYSAEGERPAPANACPRCLLSSEGEPFEFNSESELQLQVGGGREVGGRFASIQVRPDLFSARTVAGESLRVPMRDIRQVETRVFSPGKTVGALAGVTGGTLLVAGIVWIAGSFVSFAHSNH